MTQNTSATVPHFDFFTFGYGAFLSLGLLGSADAAVRSVNALANAGRERVLSAASRAHGALAGLGASSGYFLNWAHEERFLSLGAYFSFVRRWTLGCSFLMHTVYAGENGYKVYQGAYSQQQTPEEGERHDKLFLIALFRVVGHTQMIAWSILGLAMLGGAISPYPRAMIALSAVGRGILFGTDWEEIKLQKKATQNAQTSPT